MIHEGEGFDIRTQKEFWDVIKSGLVFEHYLFTILAKLH